MALLASQLQVETFIISTDAEYVYLNYKQPNQHALDHLCISAAQRTWKPASFRLAIWAPRSLPPSNSCVPAGKK